MSADHYPYTGIGEFVPYGGPRLTEDEMSDQAAAFYDLMARRGRFALSAARPCRVL